MRLCHVHTCTYAPQAQESRGRKHMRKLASALPKSLNCNHTEPCITISYDWRWQIIHPTLIPFNCWCSPRLLFLVCSDGLGRRRQRRQSICSAAWHSVHGEAAGIIIREGAKRPHLTSTTNCEHFTEHACILYPPIHGD